MLRKTKFYQADNFIQWPNLGLVREQIAMRAADFRGRPLQHRDIKDGSVFASARPAAVNGAFAAQVLRFGMTEIADIFRFGKRPRVNHAGRKQCVHENQQGPVQRPHESPPQNKQKSDTLQAEAKHRSIGVIAQSDKAQHPTSCGRGGAAASKRLA